MKFGLEKIDGKINLGCGILSQGWVDRIEIT